MNQLEIDVQRIMEEYAMLRSGDRVLIGLSGGADSVCLLEVLCRLRDDGRLPLMLYAVHVHHGLRESADGDESFVQRLCRERDVPLTVSHVNVAEQARRRGMSVEETGRVLRREAFAGVAGKLGDGTKIALAHHREDSAETLLLNLCRGTSLAGLCGIRPVSELQPEDRERGTATYIIRPLIRASREEIEDWLLQNGLSWREDETNQDVGYTRNYLRNHIFPELSGHVNAASGEHMARTARELLETEEFLQEETRRAAADCRKTRENGQTIYLTSKLAALPPVLQRRVLYLALTQAAGSARNLSSAHVQELQQLISSGGSARLDLPGALTAVREYDELRFEKKGSAWEEASSEGCPSRETAVRALPQEGGGELLQEDSRWPLSAQEYSLRVLPYDGQTPPTGCYAKWLDYDKISAPITLRARQKGDRIAIGICAHTGNAAASAGKDIGPGAEENFHYKKLTRVMIDEKVPVRLRDLVVLPMDGRDVLWFPGWRISARHQVTDSTQRILEIRWQGQAAPRSGKIG